jgi:hypothetical protein
MDKGYVEGYGNSEGVSNSNGDGNSDEDDNGNKLVTATVRAALRVTVRATAILRVMVTVILLTIVRMIMTKVAMATVCNGVVLANHFCWRLLWLCLFSVGRLVKSNWSWGMQTTKCHTCSIVCIKA